MRLLFQDADRKPVRQPGLTIEVFVLAGHDAQQGALARSVATQDTDLCARIKGQPDIFEHLALTDLLGQLCHLENIFLRHSKTRLRQCSVYYCYCYQPKSLSLC